MKPMFKMPRQIVFIRYYNDKKEGKPTGHSRSRMMLKCNATTKKA